MVTERKRGAHRGYFEYLLKNFHPEHTGKKQKHQKPWTAKEACNPEGRLSRPMFI
jgi:hypothetical protein